MAAIVVRLMCREGIGLCDAHARGEIPTDAKCPGMCDAPGCREQLVDVGEDSDGDDSYCHGHAALVAAGAEPQELLDACIKADRYGVTLARLLREAVRMVPLDPGA